MYLSFIVSVETSIPSEDILMAREGYYQKVEIVDVKREVVIWVKEE
jgi:hypothetical protein